MPRQAFSVAAVAGGVRLDRFLAQSLPDEIALSRTSLVRMIEKGAVEVDGRPVTTRALLLRAGQEVSLNLAHNEMETEKKSCKQTLKQTFAPLEILYEDEHLLCFVKPAGLTTHPASSVRGETLVDYLKMHCAPHLAGYPHDPRCGIVHRLDRETSGVMVAAKSEEARLALATMFASHDLERCYLALVWGVPMLRAGTIDVALARHPVQRTRMAVCRDSGGQGKGQRKGRRAVTHYRLLRTFGDGACLLRCSLETGRTHQIRVHLSSIGHAVMGDPLYGDSNPSARRRAWAGGLPLMGRQALHAERLAFVHPIGGEELSFSAPPPRDFRILLEALQEL